MNPPAVGEERLFERRQPAAAATLTALARSQSVRRPPAAPTASRARIGQVSKYHCHGNRAKQVSDAVTGFHDSDPVAAHVQILPSRMTPIPATVKIPAAIRLASNCKGSVT
jgi:hypothetical protein